MTPEPLIVELRRGGGLAPEMSKTRPTFPMLPGTVTQLRELTLTTPQKLAFCAAAGPATAAPERIEAANATPKST